MSYISLADAKSWIAAHIRSTDRTGWDALSDAEKTIAMQEAEDKIDDLPLRGRKYDIEVTAGIPDQQAEFPRIIDGITVSWNDSTNEAIVPQDIKDAVCLEAVALAQWGSSWRRKNQEQGVTQINLGGVQESYSATPMLLSSRAMQIMRKYIGAEIR